jgi:hypothetical protein
MRGAEGCGIMHPELDECCEDISDPMFLVVSPGNYQLTVYTNPTG